MPAAERGPLVPVAAATLTGRALAEGAWSSSRYVPVQGAGVGVGIADDLYQGPTDPGLPGMACAPTHGICVGGRVATTQREVRALRQDIGDWLSARRADHRFVRFAGHFIALEQVTRAMLDAIDSVLSTVDTTAPSGVVYERCRDADAQLGVVARLHAWYADKYDQRLEDVGGLVLRGADEVVRSCWTDAFLAVDRRAPAGPLVYLDARFDAVATPRVSVPTDLRAPADAVVGEFVRELPIPIVALPALCRTQPWWVVLAAHETGHHVQHDLAPGLVATTRETLAEAAGPDHGDCWAAWGQEVFADAFAVLAVGTAAAWAVENLQHGAPQQLVTMPSPGRRYPPPVVRTALLGELARVAGCDRPGLGADDMTSWLDTLAPDAVAPPVRVAVEAQLALVPRVGRAVVEMRVDGVPMRELCGWDAGTFTANGPVSRWVTALHSASPIVAGRGDPAAARHGVAAGVEVYRALACRDAEDAQDTVDARLQPLREHLPALLAACGPPGTLAATAPADLAGVTGRLTARLRTVTEGPA